MKLWYYVCSAPAWSVKHPGWCWCWRPSPRKKLLSLQEDSHHQYGPRLSAAPPNHYPGGSSLQPMPWSPISLPLFPLSTFLHFLFFIWGLLLHHPHQLRVKHVRETLSRSAGTHKHTPLLPAIAFYSPWVSNKRGFSICLMVWYNIQSR